MKALEIRTSQSPVMAASLHPWAARKARAEGSSPPSGLNAVHKGPVLPGASVPADGYLDIPNFPPTTPRPVRVIIWTDTEHTSAIKKENNKPREIDLFSVWWKDNGWLICPDMRPGVLGERKPNDINIHSRAVTQLCPVLMTRGENNLQNTGSSPPHLWKEK